MNGGIDYIHELEYVLKILILTLTSMAQLVGHYPAKRMVTGSIPGQGTCLGCRFRPRQGMCVRQLIDVSHINVFCPLFLSPSRSL